MKQLIESLKRQRDAVIKELSETPVEERRLISMRVQEVEELNLLISRMESLLPEGEGDK